MNEKRFVGPFAEYFTALVEEKRAQGYAYTERARELHILDKMSLEYNCTGGLPQQLVLDYVARQPHWSQATQENRVHTAHIAAVYLSRHGITAYDCDKGIVTKHGGEFAPYIFTDEEICRIFEQADHITPNRSNNHLLHPVLMRMLYGCDLRISEALKLKMCDVDLKNGVLKVNNSKNHKDRLVPMHDSLVKYCREYAQKLHPDHADDGWFFASRKGPYHEGTIYHYFRELLFRAGISHGGRGTGPRLHDLRHTFCVKSLHKMLEQGIPAEKALQLLSFYVGHGDLSATGRYLRLTAEVFPEVSARFENWFQGQGLEVACDESRD